MLHRSFGLGIIILLAPLLFGCVGLLGPEKARPAHSGTHAVGVTTLRVEDAERNRTLDVEVWYPAKPATGEAVTVVYRMKAGGTTVARLRSPMGAHRNAKVDRRHGAHPVVLLSHGAGSSRFGSMSLSEVLASHGYIVAAPDHAGHTSSDKVLGISDDDRARSAYDRPIDLSRVLDELIARDGDEHSLLEGAVDARRVAVAGHSFGGRAALGLVGASFNASRQKHECESDPSDRRCRALPVFGDAPYRYRDERVKAALLITPAGFKFYRADGIHQVDAPVLVVGASDDHTTPFAVHQQPIFESLPGTRYLLELPKAGHLTATDICEVVSSIGFLAKTFGGERAVDGCGAQFMSNREALDRVVQASLPFFDLHLNGHTAAAKELHGVVGRVKGMNASCG